MRTHPDVWAVVGAAMLLPAFALAAPSQGQSAQPAEPPAAAYLLRATSRWATAVNQVLSRVARPVEIMVSAGQPADTFLSKYCAGTSPQYEDMGQSDRGQQKIRISPCVRVRRNVEVQVTAGDTLEGLAIRHGLPPTAAGRLKVMSENESVATRAANPESLKIGDTVVVPEVPIWTSVVAKQNVPADRASIVALLAAALQCGKEEPEQCLLKREVTLLDRAVPKREPDPDPLSAPPAGTAGAGGGRGGRGSITISRREKSTSASAATAAVVSPPVGLLPPPPPPPATVMVSAAPAAATTIPVALDQWPYDVKLLGKILSDVADKVDGRTIVGIADGGLANAAGGPLPGAVFAPSPEEINRIKKNLNEPDHDDNDGNDYMDDFFGAGLKRIGEDLGDWLGSGDMGLCRSAAPSFATWPAGRLLEASHGTLVASIAAALGVRATVPAASAALPKLVFYRLLDDTCDPAAVTTVNVAELFTAFEYLAKRQSRVISISYKVDDDTGQLLRDRLKPLVPNLDGLLILAAGNQNTKLDDNGAVCPACLGNSSDERGGAAAKRTIVVGAATRELRREPLSNYGKDTVKLFAPGDPTTGFDLLQNGVPASEASTSFAAPYAALAAAIIGSFKQLNSWADIRDRLEAAVWPLQDPDAGTDATRIGVVDLVKAAAVRHDAIEVKEPDAEGRLVRRTYVGTLLTTLDGQVCPGFQLTDAKVHALRISEPAADVSRQVLVHHRSKRDPAAPWKRKVDTLPACWPTGDLQLRTVFGDVKTFPLSDVTHIQLAWIIDL